MQSAKTDYDTFGGKSGRADTNRRDSERSDTSSTSLSSRDVNIFHSVVRTYDTCFGKLRVPSDLENVEIAFLLLATVSILGVIAMTIYRLANTVDESDSTFGLVVLVNSVFCLMYIFHGVFGERPYELWAFIVATIAVALYCVIEYAVTSRRNTIKLVRLIVLLVFAPVVLWLSFKISMQHYSSKNLIIRTLHSANIAFQNMCVNMFIFQTLLKFDFQTAISLVILILTDGVEDTSTAHTVILAVGIFLEILWFIVGYLLPKYEDKTWVAAFLVLSLPQPAYVFYKIIKTGMNWKDQSNTINASVVAVACLFLVTRCLVSFYLWIVTKNFGKGLSQAVYYPDQPENKNKTEGKRMRPSKSDEPDDDYLGENVNYDVHN